MLADIETLKKTIGIKQTTKAVEKGTVKKIYIAEDAEPHVTDKLKYLCKNKKVQVIYVEDMKGLGKACGIDVGASVVGILD